MTIFFRNNQITIYRNRKISGADRYNMTATYTAYNADIQPASQERQQMEGLRFGASFTGFVDSDVDIKEGDQILVDSKRYSVKGVSNWSGAGLLDHKELLLSSEDA